MKDINLCDFNEIFLSGDIKYLRFIEKKTNRLYLIEDYSKESLEDKISDLDKLNNMDEVKKYFIDKDDSVNIFEFIPVLEIKKHYDIINNMNEVDRKNLTTIIKEVKNLEIVYINLTYFFVQTKDGSLYYANYLKKTNASSLKSLKIIKTIKPADYKKIVKDIKTYQAFIYQNRTIKYEEIKEYIENDSLVPTKDVALIEGIRKEFLKEKINNKPVLGFDLEKNKEKEKTKEIFKSVKNEEAKDIKKESKKSDDLISLKDKINNNQDKNNKKDEIKPVLVKNKKRQLSLFTYCFIGFSVGILLAAITIIIGNFIWCVGRKKVDLKNLFYY